MRFDLSLSRRLLLGGAGLGLLHCAPATPLSRTPDRAKPPPDIEGALAELERDAGGRLGVAALDTDSGGRVTYRAGERFPMCSTFKLPLVAAVLQRVDAGQEQLSRHVSYDQAAVLEYAPTTSRYVADGLSPRRAGSTRRCDRRAPRESSRWLRHRFHGCSWRHGAHPRHLTERRGTIMAVVITRLCQDCVDGACVDHCPVDAIVEHRPADRTSELPNQLLIDPDLCICCSACIPECPWEAIFHEEDLPPAFVDDIALNRRTLEKRDEYHVPIARLHRRVTTEEVDRNRERWLSTAGPAR